MSTWWCYWCKYEFVPIYATPCSKCVDGNGFTPLYATPCGKHVDGGKYVHKVCARRMIEEREDGENHDES